MRFNIAYLSVTAILTLALAKSQRPEHQRLCDDVIRGWLNTLRPKVIASNATLSIGKICPSESKFIQ